MTTREKAPVVLTATGARRLTDRLVTTLTEAHEVLIDLWVGRAWEALEYPNWEAYCKAELGDMLMVKLPPTQRREAAERMKAAGMSYRKIAAPFGVSPASIHADLAPPKPAKSVQKLNAHDAGVGSQPVNPAGAVGTSSVLPAPRSGYRAAVALVAAQGAYGLTYVELCAQTGWRGGQATGALSKAAGKGLIRPTLNFRDGCSAYVVAA